MLKFWCLICKAFTLHSMRDGIERGRCIRCNEYNWQPMGDGD